MKLTSGKIDTAIKTVIYGPEGIGKSTLAAQFPRPVFIDTEGSTVHMDGETAYRFIHYRDVEHLYTNLDRMNRQQDFLTAFTAALKETIKSRPWKISGLLKELKIEIFM